MTMEEKHTQQDTLNVLAKIVCYIDKFRNTQRQLTSGSLRASSVVGWVAKWQASQPFKLRNWCWKEVKSGSRLVVRALISLGERYLCKKYICKMWQIIIIYIWNVSRVSRSLLPASVRLSTDYTQIYGILNEIKNNIFLASSSPLSKSAAVTHKTTKGWTEM